MPNVEPMTISTLADYVKATRTSRGLTINEASRRAGVSNTLWRQVERGDKTSFRDVTLHRVADAIDVNPEELFRLAGRPWSGQDAADSTNGDQGADLDVEVFTQRLEELADAALLLLREIRSHRRPSGNGRARPSDR